MALGVLQTLTSLPVSGSSHAMPLSDRELAVVHRNVQSGRLKETDMLPEYREVYRKYRASHLSPLSRLVDIVAPVAKALTREVVGQVKDVPATPLREARFGGARAQVRQGYTPQQLESMGRDVVEVFSGRTKQLPPGTESYLSQQAEADIRRFIEPSATRQAIAPYVRGLLAEGPQQVGSEAMRQRLYRELGERYAIHRAFPAMTEESARARRGIETAVAMGMTHGLFKTPTKPITREMAVRHALRRVGGAGAMAGAQETMEQGKRIPESVAAGAGLQTVLELAVPALRRMAQMRRGVAAERLAREFDVATEGQYRPGQRPGVRARVQQPILQADAAKKTATKAAKAATPAGVNEIAQEAALRRELAPFGRGHGLARPAPKLPPEAAVERAARKEQPIDRSAQEAAALGRPGFRVPPAAPPITQVIGGPPPTALNRGATVFLRSQQNIPLIVDRVEQNTITATAPNGSRVTAPIERFFIRDLAEKIEARRGGMRRPKGEAGGVPEEVLKVGVRGAAGAAIGAATPGTPEQRRRRALLYGGAFAFGPPVLGRMGEAIGRTVAELPGTQTADTVTLYRAQARPGIESQLPQWIKDNPEYQKIRVDAGGRWYSDDLTIAQEYLDRMVGRENGEIVMITVPRHEAEAARVSNLPSGHPARTFSKRPAEEFFLSDRPGVTETVREPIPPAPSEPTEAAPATMRPRPPEAAGPIPLPGEAPEALRRPAPLPPPSPPPPPPPSPTPPLSPRLRRSALPAEWRQEARGVGPEDIRQFLQGKTEADLAALSVEDLRVLGKVAGAQVYDARYSPPDTATLARRLMRWARGEEPMVGEPRPNIKAFEERMAAEEAAGTTQAPPAPAIPARRGGMKRPKGEAGGVAEEALKVGVRGAAGAAIGAATPGTPEQRRRRALLYGGAFAFGPPVLGRMGEAIGRTVAELPAGEGVAGRPTAADKLIELIKTVAVPLREKTTAMQTTERASRFGQLEQIAEGAGGGQEFLQKGRAALTGALPQAEVPEATLAGKLNEAEIKDLLDYPFRSEALSDVKDKFRAINAIDKLLNNSEIPIPSDLSLLEKVYGQDFVRTIIDARKGGDANWKRFLDTIGASRALMTSFDVSAPRQGWMLGITKPRQFVHAFSAMIKAMANKDVAKTIHEDIITRPQSALRRQMLSARQGETLYIAPFDTAVPELGGREELFAQSIMGRFQQLPTAKRALTGMAFGALGAMEPGIPMTQRAGRLAAGTAAGIFGPKVVEVSERGFVTFLNKLRADVFDATAEQFIKSGVTYAERPDVFHSLAGYINLTTGRGKLPRILDPATLNTIFFAPRFLASRLQTPYAILTGGAGVTAPEVRKMAALDTVKAVGAGLSLLALAKYSGLADVDLDPRSPDFAKAKVGNTRLDPWSGYQPLARYIAQAVTREHKTPEGLIKQFQQEYKGQTALSLLGRFARFKLAPAPGLAVDVLENQTVTGKPVDVVGGLFERGEPLALRDLYEAAQEHGGPAGLFSLGGLGGATTALPGIVGFGVQTYVGDPMNQILSHAENGENEWIGFRLSKDLWPEQVFRFISGAEGLDKGSVESVRLKLKDINVARKSKGLPEMNIGDLQVAIRRGLQTEDASTLEHVRQMYQQGQKVIEGRRKPRGH